MQRENSLVCELRGTATAQPLLWILTFLLCREAGLPKDNPPRESLRWGDWTLRLLTELRMFEKVNVTDAMAEDMEKLRPRLKNVHIRELAVAITMMPKIQEATCTCRRRCHCSRARPALHPAAPRTAHPGPRWPQQGPS